MPCETRTIRLELAPRHNTVQVEGQVLCNGQPVQSFNFTPRQLPASVRTAYGYGFYGRYGRYAYSHYGNNNDKSIKR